MVKLLVFAILLASSPATALLETLYSTENNCYSGCYTNYAANSAHLDACRKGCDFKLLNEDCATQCKSTFSDEDIQASCQVGCTLSHTEVEDIVNKPTIDIDPVSEDKEIDTVPSIPEPERPRSIILIRLRQRPTIQQLFNNDPVQMFNDMIKQFQEQTAIVEQSIRKSLEEHSKELPQLPDFGPFSNLVQSIPIIRLPVDMPSEVSIEEANNNENSLIDEMRHVMGHPREHNQYFREHMEPVKNGFQQFFTDVRTEWNDLIRKQPNMPVWIFLCIFLSSSAILWYMILSLCRHTPSRNAVSIRAQELVFHPYDYEGYEKEKIQPDDEPYEVTESLPIKVKLSNI